LSRWLNHWLLVSSRWPLVNSSPIEMISARMGSKEQGTRNKEQRAKSLEQEQDI
jgi:hypothetical protein